MNVDWEILGYYYCGSIFILHTLMSISMYLYINQALQTNHFHLMLKDLSHFLHCETLGVGGNLDLPHPSNFYNLNL